MLATKLSPEVLVQTVYIVLSNIYEYARPRSVAKSTESGSRRSMYTRRAVLHTAPPVGCKALQLYKEKSTLVYWSTYPFYAATWITIIHISFVYPSQKTQTNKNNSNKWKKKQILVAMDSTKTTKQGSNDTTIVLHQSYILCHFQTHTPHSTT